MPSSQWSLDVARVGAEFSEGGAEFSSGGQRPRIARMQISRWIREIRGRSLALGGEGGEEVGERVEDGVGAGGELVA
jgi:hypothetical protein